MVGFAEIYVVADGPLGDKPKHDPGCPKRANSSANPRPHLDP